MDGERQNWTEIKRRKRWSELEEGRCKEPRGRENLLGWRESERWREEARAGPEQKNQKLGRPREGDLGSA